MFHRENLPQKAKSYITIVTMAGCSVLAYALYQASVGTNFQWLYLACLTLVGSFFTVMIPSKRRNEGSLTITVSDIFIYSGVLLFSPEVAVVICAIDAVLGSSRTQIGSLYKAVFNVCQLCLVTFVIGHLLYFLVGEAPPLVAANLDLATFLVQLSFCSLLYFMLNSSAVALAISLATGETFTDLWRENFSWASHCCPVYFSRYS